MSKSLDEKILEAYQELKKQGKINRHLEHINVSLQKLEGRINWLDEDLIKAGRELVRRQDAADSRMYQLFQYLFQPEEETESKIEQENHQYYLKVMELKEMKKQRDLLLFEKKVLQEKKENLKLLDLQLKKMLEKKEFDFSEWSKNDEYRSALSAEQEHIFFHRLLIKEMEEVLQEARLCRDTLNDLIEDLEKVQGLDFSKKFRQGQFSSGEKIALGRRLQKGSDFLGKHLRELNIQLKDISVSLEIDYQDEFQYFEDFTEKFFHILLTSNTTQLSLEKLSLQLHQIRNDVLKIMDNMLKDIGLSERSIKRSERKKELLILLEIKHRKNN